MVEDDTPPKKEKRPYRTGGYVKERAHHGATGNTKQGPRVVEVLPHPEVLESYNYIVDGSAQMILSMFEQEQKHRHVWETTSLKIYATSSIIGQLLGFFIAVAVFVSASVIGIYGDGNIAAFIWVFGMAIIVMAGLVWAYAKSMGQRPLFARPTMRTHYRPQKQKKKQPLREDDDE